MARQPLRLPNGPLIFKELRAVGFWISAWYRRASPEAVQAMIDALAERVRSGVLHQQVAAVYPLAQVAEAVAHARRDGRDGKVLLALDA
jgi:NADPH:quinone reductase-like Zn-dependent oxidoreductase